MYKIKNNTLALKFNANDIDETQRRVTGYLSAFDVVDADGDVIQKGAFKKSLEERGTNSSSNRRIAYLRMHDFDQQIGKFIELQEDDKGLKFVGQLGRSSKGQDALLDYQDGIIKEHSIGFLIPEGKMEIRQDGIRLIKEVNLFEGSAVVFGANEFTEVLEVTKSENVKDYIDKLNSKMNTVIGALKNGKGTDERLYTLECTLRQIQQKYNLLIDRLKSERETSTLNSKTDDNLNTFYHNLIGSKL